MESFFIYLIKCSSFLGIFYISYLLFLKKETFFHGNRFFLIGGILASLLLPLIVFTKVIWIAPLTKPVINETVQSASGFVYETLSNTDKTAETINWWAIAGTIYFIGLLFFFGRLTIQLISLLRLFKRSSIIKKESFKFVKTSDNTSPFSFFNYVVYNPELHPQEELDIILEHEKVHSKQLHSIDILLGHLLAIFLWLNPFSWAYKKSIAQNLEFIADNSTASETATVKDYQYMLLKVAIHSQQYSITNNFFNSLIKKRIVMLNQVQSQKHRAWKYALILPLLAAFIMSFNVKEVYKIRPVETTNISSDHTLDASKTVEFVISKDTSNEELKAMLEDANSKGISLYFDKIKRNKSGKIINIDVKIKNENGYSNYTGYNALQTIKPFIIYKELNDSKFTYIGRISGASMYANPDLNAKELQILLEKINKRIFELGVQNKHDVPSPLFNNNGSTPIITLDDDIISEDELNHQDRNSLSSWKTLQPEEAEKKYGEAGKNGAIAIKKKKVIDQEIDRKKIEFKITKNTSDEQLDEMIKKAKQEGHVLKFEQIKRNNNNEITAINISLKDKNGGSSNYSVNGDEAIKAITIYNESGENNNYSYISSGNNKKLKGKALIKKIKSKPEKSKKKQLKGKAYKNKNKNKKIIHEEVEIEENEELLEEIEEVLEEAEEIEEIEVIHETVEEQHETHGFLSVTAGDDPNSTLRIINEGKDKPLILLDGNEITERKLRKIKSGTVATIDISKGEEAIKKYGEKAKGGVISISLKK
ncbi:hypothetical protein GTQ40_16410 [Flavobacteriaceae bacterium R38]|nr:hypothetical protein [Flavobacteriaceae bacterium R38]